MNNYDSIDDAIDSDLDVFLSRNRVNGEQWSAANIEWDVLKDIGKDHQSQRLQLEQSAQLIANTVQSFEKVHSVRWRVKDSNHLMKKIIRKRADEQPKYMDISAENYFTIVADLVGIRALHLFKEDCFAIDAPLKKMWAIAEGPIAYLREGDPDELKAQLTAANFEVKTHPAGYRSVHYVISSQPLKRQLLAELQVRTIFEEGWSEIDHIVKYPDFSDNPTIGYFLKIFNRLAGSADEMGTFVQSLSGLVAQYEEDKSTWNEEGEAASKKIAELITKIEQASEKSENNKQVISDLRDQISRLNTPPRIEFGLDKQLADARRFDANIAKRLMASQGASDSLKLLLSGGLRPKKIGDY